MRKIITLAAIAAALALSQSAAAKDEETGVVAYTIAPTALNAGSAYLLMRVSTAKSGIFAIQPVLLRIPTAQEMAQYRADAPVRANTFVIENKKFLEDGEMRTVLIEVPPGTYVLYGITLGGRGLVTCNCLGTVRFAAKPGVITNVGALYADKVHKKSPVPNLEDNVGPSMFNYGFIFGEGLVPADASTPVPASLQGLKIQLAQFEVVGQFYEPGAGSINRLAPIAGLLGYERGRAVDLRTGKRPD